MIAWCGPKDSPSRWSFVKRRSPHITLFIVLAFIGLASLITPVSAGPTQDPVLVVVDAGHGGSDTGAKSFDGLQEKDITLTIARLLQFLAWGDPDVRIILTRESDVFIPLSDRTDIANRWGAALYLSIHVNALPRDSNVSGVLTLVPTSREPQLAARDLILARTLHHTLVDQLGNVVDRGVFDQRLYLRWAKMPAALVETGFITNPKEAQKLETLWYQLKIAKALLDGIKAYLHRSTS